MVITINKHVYLRKSLYPCGILQNINKKKEKSLPEIDSQDKFQRMVLMQGFLTVGAMLIRENENCACLEDFSLTQVYSEQYDTVCF